MKRVRFETPYRNVDCNMNDTECQSPRPFIERKLDTVLPNIYFNSSPVPYSNDPLERFENSNGTPHPFVNKTVVSRIPETCWQPSPDLELSMLDIHEPRKYLSKDFLAVSANYNHTKAISNSPRKISSPSSNTMFTPPNVLNRNDSFFLREADVNNILSHNAKPLQKVKHDLSLEKENNPLQKKREILNIGATKFPSECISTIRDNRENLAPIHNNMMELNINNACNCHHCIRISNSRIHCGLVHTQKYGVQKFQDNMLQYCRCCVTEHVHQQPEPVLLPLSNNNSKHGCQCQIVPEDAIEKKKTMIDHFERGQKNSCTELDRQTVVKEKREPTVADLFKIIKLQNEQLQLLQEKVDKFVSASQSSKSLQTPSLQSSNNDQMTVGISESQQKISIGVMTSFEMVRTSTVINHEVVKQISDINSQSVQCNRSQISIKEVMSKPDVNFLDGISSDKFGNKNLDILQNNTKNSGAHNNDLCKELLNDEKTMNEISLYNVQVDNATTPLISPEQTMYLDVRDYSDSDSECNNNHSNVGWTYYNKVMTHVNGMLQDSDMPSSASALFRNTRQQCMQMQFDKTNVSVTKRVTFGDNPIVSPLPQMYPGGYQQIPPVYPQPPHLQPSTDTSLKMNQLAAKYLKTTQPAAPQQIPPKTVDMSLATRNYMERHQLLQGVTTRPPPPVLPPATSPNDIPRFLDITALKQQPKLL